MNAGSVVIYFAMAQKYTMVVVCMYNTQHYHADMHTLLAFVVTSMCHAELLI
jgi:hypothetical protein